MSNGEEDPLSQELEDEVQSRLAGFRDESTHFETGDLVQGYTGQSFRSNSSGTRPPIDSSDGLGSLNTRANPRFFEETRTFQETIDGAPSSNTNMETEANADQDDAVSAAADVLLALSPDERAQAYAIAASIKIPTTTDPTTLETPTKRNVSFEQHPTSVIASTNSTVSPITTSTGVRTTAPSSQALAVQPYQGALVSAISSGVPPRGEEKKIPNSRFKDASSRTNKPPPVCRICKSTDHFTAKCPNWCKKCKATHRPEDCPRQQQPPPECDICGEPHPAEECPLCPRCGQHPTSKGRRMPTQAAWLPRTLSDLR